MSPRRRVLSASAILLLVIASVYTAGEIYRRRDHSSMFASLHGDFLEAVISPRGTEGGRTVYSIVLSNDRGITVDGHLIEPEADGGRYPALIVLGGLRTGRDTIDFLTGYGGIVILSLDYPYGGKREDVPALEFALSIPRIRRAVLSTVPASMIGVDYLLTRSDVDPERIILAGGSLGALFVPATAACDERVAAAALLFGGGDIEKLMKANFKGPAWLFAPAAWIAAVLLSPVEPADYIGEISPRPLFLLNGRNDPRIPAACARILEERAGEPATATWIETGHVDIRSAEFHEIVTAELIRWLEDRGLYQAPGR
jgi:predicted esterase